MPGATGTPALSGAQHCAYSREDWRATTQRLPTPGCVCLDSAQGRGGLPGTGRPATLKKAMHGEPRHSTWCSPLSVCAAGAAHGISCVVAAAPPLPAISCPPGSPAPMARRQSFNGSAMGGMRGGALA